MNLVFALLILFGSQIVLAETFQTEYEHYDWFAKEAVYDSDLLSDAEAKELVRKGIASSDERVVERTIDSMALLARALKMTGPDGLDRDSSQSRRTLDRIPGVKEFLIDYWRANRRVYDPEVGVEPYLRSTDPSVPAWHTIGGILVTFFPEDETVLRWIWEKAEWHKSTGNDAHPRSTLMLLDRGNFRSKEAQELRIACLDSPDRNVVSRAAAGLARFRSKEGLRALAKQLDHERGRGDIVRALAEYGSKALPYMDLPKLKGHYRRRGNLDLVKLLETLERLGESEASAEQVE